jgi:hypothetical protein
MAAASADNSRVHSSLREALILNSWSKDRLNYCALLPHLSEDDEPLLQIVYEILGDSTRDCFRNRLELYLILSSPSIDHVIRRDVLYILHREYVNGHVAEATVGQLFAYFFSPDRIRYDILYLLSHHANMTGFVFGCLRAMEYSKPTGIYEKIKTNMIIDKMGSYRLLCVDILLRLALDDDAVVSCNAIHSLWDFFLELLR